jgi:hypothetical protein
MEKRTRPIREYFFSVSLALMATCLSAAFVSARQWAGMSCSIGLGAFWFALRNRQSRWLPHLFLLGALGLSAAAILTGSIPVLSIAGAGFSLAAWDLHQLNVSLQNSPMKESTRRFKQRHLWSLILALVIGLAIAIIGRMVTLQIPFILLAAVILLTVFGLDRLWNVLGKSK